MNAGKLRHVITIQSLSATADDLGGLTSRTVFADNVRASVAALQGRELYKAQQVVAEVTHMIDIRWMAGVQAKMTILFNGRLFEIVAVLNPDERTKELHLLCLERNDGTVGV